LIEAVWPEQDSARAVKRLQVAVTWLRKTLARADRDERRLLTVTDGYLLAVGPDELDAQTPARCGRLAVGMGEDEAPTRARLCVVGVDAVARWT
jgi:DNA-binding SARP family transcriptional activator